jgi:hypothetical protein
VVRRSVNGIANKVGKNLAQLAGKSMDAKRGSFLIVDIDVFGLQLDHVEREHGLHHVLKVELNRDLGFALEERICFVILATRSSSLVAC